MFPNKDCIDCPPCPPVIPAVPIPDLSHVCGGQYNLSCVQYTGPNITCLGIVSGMMMSEVLSIFNTALLACDCCFVPPPIPVDCVVSEWSDWSTCVCIVDGPTTICTQERTRSVLTPASGGGVPCPVLTETRCCPVNCSGFYSYSTCDPATSTRTGDFIIVTLPNCGGTPCPPMTITESCIPDVDCVLLWSTPSSCIGGFIRETATIVTPSSGTGQVCGPLERLTACAPPPSCSPVTNVLSRLIPEPTPPPPPPVSCNKYNHTIELYECSDCSVIGTDTLGNTEQLIVNEYYYDSITEYKFRVVSYDGCVNDSITDRTILASIGETLCEDVICPPCFRPTGLSQAMLLGAFNTEALSPCGPTTNIIGTAPTFEAACAMWQTLKNCVCPSFSIPAFGYTFIEYSILAIGNKMYQTYGGTDCEYAPEGMFFFWGSTDATSISFRNYFCPLTYVAIITIGAKGVITDIRLCGYTP